MAVSKRTRFEVLRRDNYTCRYCRSTEGALTVDHVLPVSLGGTDDPDNLVAACRDCNAGKGSTSPDEGTVDDVRADELRWAAALAQAAEAREAAEARDGQVAWWFETTWYGSMPQWADLPDDAEWKASITRFLSLGLSPAAIEASVATAAAAKHVARRLRWKYFCGICWNKVRDLQDSARQILAAEDAERSL